MDLLQREGKYPVPPQAPKTLGVEFSGTIEELAEGSESDFKKGDAVFGLAYGGAYAEYIAVSTHMLIHKPDELSWEQCAGIPEVCPSHQLIQAKARGLSKSVDLDHSASSNVPDRRIQAWKVDPLARRRIVGFHCRSTIERV
jgi:NADPH:quinone reductase-like Zn-dependent oxidoreductase